MDSPLSGTPGAPVAIVTGASGGVGRAVVGALADRGYAVVVGYLHDRDAARSTVEAMLAGDAAAVAVRADVTDDLDVERLFAETVEAFRAVDVVVHVVGGRARAASVAESDPAEFDALCRLNVRGTFLVDREAARRLRGGGAIVNVVRAAVDGDVPGRGIDAATSAAVRALTRVLARELGDRGVRVHAVPDNGTGPGAARRVADAVVSLLGPSAGGHPGPGIGPG